MSKEYPLTLGQALQAAVDDGATIEANRNGYTMRLVDGTLVDTPDNNEIPNPLRWPDSVKFRIVPKKMRLLTVPEIFEKFPDACFNTDGDLLLQVGDGGSIPSDRLSRLGGTNIEGARERIQTEVEDD